MLITIVTEDGERTVTTYSAIAQAGRCPSCGAVLVVETPEEDTDAVCLACGDTVGRCYPRSVSGRTGVATRRRGRK
jgi:predicted RNA-binding Zn-ribbon protein involved in translation (DUF1610 family)